MLDPNAFDSDSEVEEEVEKKEEKVEIESFEQKKDFRGSYADYKEEHLLDAKDFKDLVANTIKNQKGGVNMTYEKALPWLLHDKRYKKVPKEVREDLFYEVCGEIAVISIDEQRRTKKKRKVKEQAKMTQKFAGLK